MLALAGRLLPVRRLICSSSLAVRASPKAATTRAWTTTSAVTIAAESNPVARVPKDLFEATSLGDEEVTPEHLGTLKTLRLLLSEAQGQLAVRPDGLVSVLEMLRHPWMANSTIETLVDVVRWDKERRYEIVYRPRVVSPVSEDWWLRIRDGYFQDPDLSCTRVVDSSNVPVAIYSVTAEDWQGIKNVGISRGHSPFIHLARGIPGREPIFEIRREKIDKVMIYVDAAKVLQLGIPLYASQRGTVATPGDRYGVLPPHVFKRLDMVKIRMERVIHEVDEGKVETLPEGKDEEGTESRPFFPKRYREWRGPAPKPSSKRKSKRRPGPKQRRAKYRPQAPLR